MTQKTQLLPAEIIRKKRNGDTLSAEEIAFFVSGITSGDVSSEQISALGMAVYFQSMTMEERAHLTLNMRDSGDVMNWQALGFDADAPIVDKHSTGGVGDKVSLMLAPIVAACGCYVPMISGRGLGHTGGTLDKLQAIPGYDPFPDNQRFADIVQKAGCSIIGQTGNLAPADKRFYGIRDVTATVESVPLITASILSKKLAAGLSALVMDVKCGNGAFMDDADKARELATSIVKVAGLAGVPTAAIITDMNEVLGRTAGNAIEVVEAITFLTEPEKAEPRLKQVTLELAAAMVHLAGQASDIADGLAQATKALDSGRAAELFQIMAVEQGGPSDLMTGYAKYLTLGDSVIDVPAPKAGVITAQDTRGLGVAVVGLGGGRTRAGDQIDYKVGIDAIKPIGTRVEKGDPLARIIANSPDQADSVKAAVTNAFVIGEAADLPNNPVVIDTVQPDA